MGIKKIIGSLITLLGATLLILAGILTLMLYLKMDEELRTIGIPWDVLGPYKPLSITAFSTTLAWGIIGVIGTILGLKQIKAGSIVQLVAGSLAVIGMFWVTYSPTYTDLGWAYVDPPPLRLSGTLFLIDPFLMIIGGGIGFLDNFSFNINTKKLYGIILISLGFVLVGFGIISMLAKITLLYLTLLPYTLGLYFIHLGTNQYKKA